jgi:hypothetical protein
LNSIKVRENYMTTQGGSAAKGGEDEALERLSSALMLVEI